MSKSSIVVPGKCVIHEDCESCELRFKCFTADEDSLARFGDITITPRAAEFILQYNISLPREKWCTGCGSKFTDKRIGINAFKYLDDGTVKVQLRIDYKCRSGGWWHSNFNSAYDLWNNKETWNHKEEVWY